MNIDEKIADVRMFYVADASDTSNVSDQNTPIRKKDKRTAKRKTITFSDENLTFINETAKENGITVTALVNAIIEQYRTSSTKD